MVTDTYSPGGPLEGGSEARIAELESKLMLMEKENARLRDALRHSVSQLFGMYDSALEALGEDPA